MPRSGASAMLRAGLALFAAAALSGAAAAVPDHAREDRWAQEVEPQIVVGDVAWLALPGRPRVLAIFTPAAGTTKGAVIVVHGLGVHPDWGLIGELRAKLADRGYATLSVQMPVLAADAPREAYRDLFDDAADRLAAAVAWLRAKGFGNAAFLSHSLGAAMTDAYLARPGTPAPAAWIAVGMPADFAAPPRAPVLDVVAERDLPEALAASAARRARLPRDGCSAATSIAGTDHFMTGATTALADAAAAFLDRVYAGRCGAARGR